jgi:hypothetical protein
VAEVYGALVVDDDNVWRKEHRKLLSSGRNSPSQDGRGTSCHAELLVGKTPLGGYTEPFASWSW